MFTVYVIKSQKNGKCYKGFTSKSLTQRLDWHRWGLTAWTRQNGPFELVHSEEYPTKQAAQMREKYFKTGQGRATLDLIIAQKESSVSVPLKRDGPAKKFGGG